MSVRFTWVVVAWLCVIPYGRGTSSQTVVDTDHLIAEYETVFVGTGVVLRGELLNYSARAGRNLKLPFGALLRAFDTLGPSARSHLERTVEEAAVGARNFTPPQGLGIVHFDFCYIVRVKELPGTIGEWLKQGGVANDASRAPRADVVMWSLPPEEGRSSPMPVYATIAGGKLLLANSLEQIDATMRPAALSRRLQDARADLEVARRGPFWGYRIFASKNPLGAGQVAIVGYEQANRALTLTVSRVRDGVVPDLPFRSKGPLGAGRWRTTVPLSDADSDWEELFSLFGIMGFEIYL